MNARNDQVLLTRDIVDGEFIDNDDPPGDEEIAYAKFRSEMSDAQSYAKINVYRQPSDTTGRPGQRKLIFLFECALDDFEYSQLLSKISGQFGTGTYRIQGRDSNGRMLFNRGVQIEAPKRDPETEPTGNDPTAMFNSFAEMMARQQENTEAMMERLTARAQNGVTPPGAMADPLTMMGTMLGMVTQLMGVMNGSQKAAPDILQEMQKFAAIKEAASSLVGDTGGGGGATLYDTLNKTVETFGPLLLQGLAAQNAAQGPGHRAQPRRLPNPNPVSNAGARVAPPNVIYGSPPNPNPVLNEAEPMEANPMLVAQVNVLLANAKNGIEPRQMARSVMGMTPDAQLDDLYQFISRPDVIEVMQAVNSEVLGYLKWFKAVRDHLLAELEPESDQSVLQSENAGINLAASSDDGPGPANDAATDASDVTGNS